jgi:hypothetical protein
MMMLRKQEVKKIKERTEVKDNKEFAELESHN